MTEIRARPADQRPRRRRTGRLMAGMLGALVVFVVLPARNAAAAPDQDPYRECTTGRLATSMTGITRNDTGVELTRVYDEKGVLNTWGRQPSASLAPRASDRWCVYAHHFGTAMKVEYALPGGDKVAFAADRYLFGDASARCELSGPTRDSYSCRAHVSQRKPGGLFYGARHVHVEFSIVAERSG